MIKSQFIDVFKSKGVDYRVFIVIADQNVVDAMLMGTQVKKADAEDVLKAFSEYAGGTYTLENVDVLLAEGGDDVTTTIGHC